MDTARVAAMSLARVYPLYVAKVERKGRSREELDQVIRWLTGYSQEALQAQLDSEASLEAFFAQAPQINPARSQVKGLICGIRVEDMAEGLMREVRLLDKLVDELAKGRKMEKILRA
ncbi:MAG: DUF2200 domain-containing protein [Christensenellales bacterium]